MVERINCTTEEIRVLKQIELIEDTELFVLLNCGGRFFYNFANLFASVWYGFSRERIGSILEENFHVCL